MSLYQGKAKGFIGRLLSKFFTGNNGTKRKVLADVSGMDNAPSNKRQRRSAVVERNAFNASSISLYQNRFKCVPVLMGLISVDEQVIITFETKSELENFLISHDAIDADDSFQTELETSDGMCLALVGDVIENQAIVNEPFQLIRGNEDDKELYPPGGGLVLELECFESRRRASCQVTVTHRDAESPAMNLWIARQTSQFEGLKEFFDGMDTADRLDAIEAMARLLDPYQQILWGYKFCS